jgi:acyl carrier protein
MTQQEHLETGQTALMTGMAGGQADHSQMLTPDDSPQGETEITVGRLFAEMLGVSVLPRTASLFDLGLDSVSVTVACARLEQTTGVRIRFSQLFRTPTVAKLAAWIDAARDKLSDERGVPANPPAAEAVALVAITPMQAEAVPITKLVVEIAWWFDGEIDDAALESAASDIHRRHQALHARYLTGPEHGLAELPADPAQAQFHRLGQKHSDTAASDALWLALRQPLRLGEGEIWRCAIVRSAQSGRALFGLAVHHAAFDGRSWDILMTELPVAYTARAAGTLPRWPGRTATLAEMAADFRHQLAAADADGQRRYWRDELRGLPACRLPGCKDVVPPSAGVRYSGPGPATYRSFTVENTQLRIWDDYARAKGMSPSVGMAAVYVEAIVRTGGTRDFGLMVSIANRAGEIIDRTITNRVGDIVLRPNGPSRSGPHILARMQDAYLQAMAARDVLLDPKELGSLLSGESSDGVIHLDRLAGLNYNSIPLLGLGGVAGTLAPELETETKGMYGVMLHVVPGSAGLSMDIKVRTDMYDESLADRLSQNFVDIISNGPERLELESAH